MAYIKNIRYVWASAVSSVYQAYDVIRICDLLLSLMGTRGGGGGGGILLSERRTYCLTTHGGSLY